MGTYGKLMALNQPAPAEVKAIPEPQTEGVVLPMAPAQKQIKAVKCKVPGTVIPRHHDTMTPRYRDTIIETIRAAVKVFGKEAATHRFTPEEKRAVKEIVFSYQQQGIRTAENEISRIGVNFLVEDYRQQGENSILHQVLTALNR